VTGLAASVCGGCGFINDVDGPSSLAIKKFTVSPAEVVPGVAAQLSWEVDGADEVEIDNGVGSVKDKGTLEVRPDRDTTYSITARAGTASATAKVRLTVGSATSASPSPGPTPSPTPTPSPSATPGPTPSPTPTPTPSPTPGPSPSPGGSSACGQTVDQVAGCAVTVQRLVSLPAGECIEITRMALSHACPMPPAGARAVAFDVTAETQLRDLRWRKAASSGDSLEPADGRLVRHGSTTAIATQTVREGALTIEILAEGTVVMSFRLRNQ
jgi:hypothetical protein